MFFNIDDWASAAQQCHPKVLTVDTHHSLKWSCTFYSRFYKTSFLFGGKVEQFNAIFLLFVHVRFLMDLLFWSK